ncbi:MAG: T9SS type A sorting domain-containing protein [Bacteroidetes bacterium]|nr:T9SS type A sorting domain-containing protein [Bacteroidota bacterium]MBK7388336.1 T9SS type A sorting domain-containing protein [Bacteroidota bacterium]MBK9423488.1 T9SS type A sorting domain-containing protein [Bacteroidota bacterium]
MKTNSTIKTKMMLIAMIGLFMTTNLMAQPWVVGTKVMTLTDASRGNRQIETEVFYPADVAGYQVALGSPVDKRFPVLVVGHGTEISWNNYQYLWDKFVPKGFIVVVPKTEMSNTPDVDAYALDLAYVAAAFEGMRWDNTSFFFKRLNGKTGVMGHGMGASAAVLACQYNTSIDALVTMGATSTTPDAVAAAALVTTPAVVFAGGEDCVAPDQMPLYNNLASSCKTYVHLDDASHCNFAQGAGTCTGSEVLCGGFPTSYQNTNHKTTYLVVSFLRYYLKSNAPALAKFEWKLQRKANLSYIMNCNSMARVGGFDQTIEESEDMVITDLKLYPNPVLSGNQVNLSIPSDEETVATVMVTNMIGQTIMTEQLFLDEDANQISLGVDRIKPGYYFVTIINGDGKLTRPLVIQ